MTTRNLIQAEQSLVEYTKRRARPVVIAVLGNNAGTVDHPTRGDGWVYARLHGDANQVIIALDENTVAHTANLVVVVERVIKTGASYYHVLGLASNIVYGTNPWLSTVALHGEQHQRRDFGVGGNDVLDVYMRSLVNLRARAQATPDATLYVERGFYTNQATIKVWSGGNSPAFTFPTAGWPEAKRRTDLLYITTGDILAIATGTETTDGSDPAYPATPANCCYPLAYVWLDDTMTTVTESKIEDARAGNTSAATALAHNVLSAQHGDTLVGAVVAGDLITGNATPKWARLARGTLNYVLKAGASVLAWGQVAFSELTGALGVGQHGTLADGDHSGDMTGNARVGVRKNSAGSVFTRRRLNLIEGANITLTVADDAGSEEIDITVAASGGGAGHTIQDEGVDLTARTNLNFVGAGVAATDDAGNDATVVTISGGGSGDDFLVVQVFS